MSSLQSAAKVLTHLGYAIRKDTLDNDEVAKLRKTLTVAPISKVSRFAKGKGGDAFPVFLESPSRFYCPRMWGIQEFGIPDAEILVEGSPIRDDLRFVGTPYDYQTEIVNTFVEKGANGLICVPCGRGKTFMAIAIAAKLGKKFMVVVDKEFLLQQWAGELTSLMPGIKIGILQENKKQISDQYDCTIAMIQTLVQRDFAETDFRSFGFSIFDECHHLGASHFSKALLKVQTKWMLGLSATPTRDDGLTKVFEWFLGKPVYWEKTREADPEVIVRKIPFNCDDDKYTTVPANYQGDIILARLLTQVVECEPRNQVIDKVIAELVQEKQRRILILSERKSHLERIQQGLPEGTTFGYYIGGMKEEVREEGAKSAQVLLGTYAMASEAMNIKTLNTMIMASPRKKIEQSTGRILRTRKDEREIQPLIIDIVDSHDVYNGQWLKRRAYYRKCAYNIEGETKKEKKKAEEVVLSNAGECMMIQDD
jgi:superfamily II DNA or RNA helicase